MKAYAIFPKQGCTRQMVQGKVVTVQGLYLLDPSDEWITLMQTDLIRHEEVEVVEDKPNFDIYDSTIEIPEDDTPVKTETPAPSDPEPQGDQGSESDDDTSSTDDQSDGDTSNSNDNEEDDSDVETSEDTRNHAGELTDIDAEEDSGTDEKGAWVKAYNGKKYYPASGERRVRNADEQLVYTAQIAPEASEGQE